MSTISQMNSVTPVSNMPFDESIEFHNSDYISLEAMDELKERVRLEREDINAYDKVFDNLPPLPPTKEEEEEEIVDEIEQQTYKGVFYADAMDMEAEIMKDIKYKMEKEFREENSKTNDKILKDKIGNGNMEYIKNLNTRDMCTNAWKAITFTNNWDFVAQDIQSFMWSDDPRIDIITEKMIEIGYDGHSGSSFGYTMRNMQYLVQNGEEKFKKLFDENAEKGVTKFLDYSGGF